MWRAAVVEMAPHPEAADSKEGWVMCGWGGGTPLLVRQMPRLSSPQFAVPSTAQRWLKTNTGARDLCVCVCLCVFECVGTMEQHYLMAH